LRVKSEINRFHISNFKTFSVSNKVKDYLLIFDFEEF
jgi:hypothetical protein